MSKNFKYTYFNAAARGELGRLIFAEAGVAYTDKRVEFAEWGELKPNTPWGSLPYLEVNGQPIGQSLAVAEYLAREFKLAGDTSEEQALSTSVVHALTDILEAGFKVMFEKDEAAKAKLVESGKETVEKILGGVNKILGNKAFIVGQKMTYADLALLNVALQSPNHGIGFSLDKYPNLKKVVEKVKESKNIKKYLAERPVTQFLQSSYRPLTLNMPYKFTYFNGAARGELSRLVLVAGGQEFTDNRIEFSQWPALKPSTPWGTLPVLEVDGKVIGQSGAVAGYLARKLGLAGATNEEQALSTSVVQALTDILEAGFKVVFEKDEAVKAKAIESAVETTEKILAGVEKILGDKEFIVGDKMTFADLALLNISLQCPKHGINFSLDKHPKLQEVVKRVQKNGKIAQYLKTRPVTEL
ncbi:uncharacterized protein LOC106158790 [Lingula anatina]|uniref:glutathione transferase n=1 Tax=Lingula anatina TaxID=7574 RepID=A0A1S3HWC2_LINAN|nr:uncharacterized protein LOC106158790 [Lingula anatina]|eukprot:XP_013390342.1 uncharacterized protein LOC106158790 [Lingula anatina]